MSDSDSESPSETKSNSKTKVRSKSKSRQEVQRSSTPKIPTPQKGSQSSVPKQVQFRPTSRVAELMSKFSYFSTNEESEKTIKSSMKRKSYKFILHSSKIIVLFFINLKY